MLVLVMLKKNLKNQSVENQFLFCVETGQFEIQSSCRGCLSGSSRGGSRATRRHKSSLESISSLVMEEETKLSGAVFWVESWHPDDLRNHGHTLRHLFASLSSSIKQGKPNRHYVRFIVGLHASILVMIFWHSKRKAFGNGWSTQIIPVLVRLRQESQSSTSSPAI